MGHRFAGNSSIPGEFYLLCRVRTSLRSCPHRTSGSARHVPRRVLTSPLPCAQIIEGREPLSPPTISGDLGTFMGWVDERRKLKVATRNLPPETRNREAQTP